MDHANIARVFDGEATERGRPCFVMELVKRTPIILSPSPPCPVARAQTYYAAP